MPDCWRFRAIQNVERGAARIFPEGPGILRSEADSVEFRQLLETTVLTTPPFPLDGGDRPGAPPVRGRRSTKGGKLLDAFERKPLGHELLFTHRLKLQRVGVQREHLVGPLLPGPVLDDHEAGRFFAQLEANGLRSAGIEAG